MLVVLLEGPLMIYSRNETSGGNTLVITKIRVRVSLGTMELSERLYHKFT